MKKKKPKGPPPDWTAADMPKLPKSRMVSEIGDFKLWGNWRALSDIFNTGTALGLIILIIYQGAIMGRLEGRIEKLENERKEVTLWASNGK